MESIQGHHSRPRDGRWIDTVHQQSFLARTPWEEVHEVLGNALARPIQQDFNSFSQSQRSALFDILGRKFFEIHMQSWKLEFGLQTEPESLRQMEKYLKEKWHKALQESHLDKLSPESKILKDFKGFLGKLFENVLCQTLENRSFIVQEQSYSGLGAMNVHKKRELLRETFNNKATRSEIMGEAIAHILDRQPGLFEEVCSKVKGHQLPGTLRRKMWLCILVTENKKAEDWSYSTLEEGFYKSLSRRKAEMNAEAADASPAKTVIQNIVKEKFRSVPCLQTLANTTTESTIEKAMNIHHVCYNISEPNSVLLLFPLFVGLFLQSPEDDVPLSLSICLNLLRSYFIPNKEVTENIVTNVLDELRVRDPNLTHHMEESAEIHKAQEFYTIEYEHSKITAARKALSDLLSTWITKAFVGILSRPALVFVWDQLFLWRWTPRVFEIVCLCLIMLLQRNLSDKAKDHQTLMKVLFEEPSRLFTIDIQRAYRYLLQGGDLKDITSFNRQNRERPTSPVPRTAPENSPPSIPVLEKMPEPVLGLPSPEEGLDLYIDGITGLPDHATITKVTGRILTPTLAVPDILAAPDLNCASHSPTYTYRYTAPRLQNTNLLLLRVYTVDALTKEVVVVGSCGWNLYKDVTKEAKLKCGAFKLRLRRGLPTNKFLPLEEDFHKLPKVPNCSLMVRVLPRSKVTAPRPPFDLSSYSVLDQSDRVIADRTKDIPRPLLEKTERQVALALRKEEEDRDDALMDGDLSTWILHRLDRSASMQSKVPPRQMEPTHFFKYSPDIGLKVKVQGAWGLKGKSTYYGVVTSLLRGMRAQSQLSGADTKDLRVLVATPELDSFLSAPQWIDRPKVLHPFHDEHSCLFLEVVGAEVQRPPVGGPAWNRPFKMGALSNFAWTIVPLFKESSLSQGVHYLPLFQETSRKPFLTKLLTEDALEVMKDNLQRRVITIPKNHPSVVLEIFDARFDHPDALPLPVETELMKITGEYEKYQKVAKGSYDGPNISSMLTGKEQLDTDIQKNTLQKTTRETFYKLVNDTLLKDGLELLMEG